jgi:hypothetical protein
LTVVPFHPFAPIPVKPLAVAAAIVDEIVSVIVSVNIVSVDTTVKVKKLVKSAVWVLVVYSVLFVEIAELYGRGSMTAVLV